MYNRYCVRDSVVKNDVVKIQQKYFTKDLTAQQTGYIINTYAANSGWEKE